MARRRKSSMNAALADMLEKFADIAHNCCAKHVDGMDCVTNGFPASRMCSCCKQAATAAKAATKLYAMRDY